MARVQIRKALSKDISKIASLMQEEFSKPSYNEKWTNRSAVSSIKKDFKKQKGMVATHNEEIVGYVLYSTEFIDQPYIFLENMVIKKEHQRKGIGKKFVDAILKIHKKGRITVSVNKKSNAYSFYKKLGFTENKINVNMSKKF